MGSLQFFGHHFYFLIPVTGVVGVLCPLQAMLHHLMWLFSIAFLLFLSIFLFYFWCSNFSFIPPTLISDYSNVPLFSPFIIFVTFLCFFSPLSSFNFVTNISSPFPSHNHFSFLCSSHILFPFILSFLLHYSFCFYNICLLMIDIAGVARRSFLFLFLMLFLMLFLCYFALFCQFLTRVYNTWWKLSLLVGSRRGVPNNEWANYNQDPNTQ